MASVLALHIGVQLPALGERIEQALNYNGQRAHFCLVAWTDEGEMLNIKNTPALGTALMLADTAKLMMDGGGTPGDFLGNNTQRG